MLVTHPPAALTTNKTWHLTGRFARENASAALRRAIGDRMARLLAALVIGWWVRLGRLSFDEGGEEE